MIILVLALLAFLFFIFVHQKKEVTPTEQSVAVDTSEIYCGITVTKPSVNSFISLPLDISGYISGCGWDSYSAYVSRLKILDEEGNIVGRPYLVPKNENALSPVSSQFNFTIKDLPVKDGQSLTLLFESFGSSEDTFSLPVVFKPDIKNDGKI